MSFPEVFYHHRASVWGIRIQDGYIVTGSMDGTIALIEVASMQIKKHFMAHHNEWGSKCFNWLINYPPKCLCSMSVSDLDTSADVIVSGCFDRLIRVWSFPDCQLKLTIEVKHAVNCVSVCNDLVASCSRTGRTIGVPNVMLWNIHNGQMIRALELPSACFVKVTRTIF